MQADWVCSTHIRPEGAAVSHPTSRELAAITPPPCLWLPLLGGLPCIHRRRERQISSLGLYLG